MGDLSCDRFGLKFDAHEVRLSKMSTVDETLSLFFRSYFFRKDLRQRVRRSRAAVVIQRAFRRYLYRKDQVIFAQSRAAILIQRCWRRYYRRQKIIQRILSTYPAEQLPYQLQMKLPKKKPVAPPSPRRVGKRKVLVELKPPWGDKKPNKLSPRDIENLMNEQKDDVTWVTKQIMPMFMQYLNKVLNGREKLQRQNKDYQSRVVMKTFYTIAPRSIDGYEPIVRMFLHAPSFAVVAVHRKGITRQRMNCGSDEIRRFRMVYDDVIVDAEMDRVSGRVFCLLRSWRITVFENGFFTAPVEIPVEKPKMYQKKCMFCDKYGYLWMFMSSTGTVYLLDPLCFSLITEIQIKDICVRQMFPIYERQKLAKIIVSAKKNSTLCLCDASGAVKAQFSSSSKYTPSFLVSSSHLVSWTKDRQVTTYKRQKGGFAVGNTFDLRASPSCVCLVKGFDILIVGQDDNSLNFFPLTSESLPLDIPKTSVSDELVEFYTALIGTPKVTQSNLSYANVLSIRLTELPQSVHAARFSDDLALVVCHLRDNTVLSYWVFRCRRAITLAYYDSIKVAPMYGPVRLYTKLAGESIYSQLMSDVVVTRKQLDRDSSFLERVDYELEKRFIAFEFKSMKPEQVTEILLQSPFRRWCRCLRMKPNTITIYEVSWLLRRLIIAKETTPSAISKLLIDSNMVKAQHNGVVSNTIAITLDRDQATKAVGIIIGVTKSEIDHYVVLREDAMRSGNALAAVVRKRSVWQYDGIAIQKLTEIENIVKNRIRNERMKKDRSCKRRKRRLAPRVPDIVKETNSPIYERKKVEKTTFLLPNPLVERYRYRPYREMNVSEDQIVYCRYSNQYPAAKVMPVNGKVPMEEVQLTRPMARMSMAIDIAALSFDSKYIVHEYPSEYIVLDYLLLPKTLTDGRPENVSISRFWLSQILMIMAGVHEQNVILRTVVPSNFFVSYDGTNVVIQTMADALFRDESPDKPLPFENDETPWMPPEYYTKQPITPAFDVFQFGILMLYTLTGFLPTPFLTVMKACQQYSKRDISDFTTSETFYYDPFDGFPKDKFPWFFYKQAELKMVLDIESSVSMWDVCRRCLDIDPARRPTSKQLLETAFFNIPAGLAKRTQTLARLVIRQPSLSLFVDSVFGTLLESVQRELQEDHLEMPTLNLMVNVLGYFLAPDDASKQLISFPVYDKTVHDVVVTIFQEKIFDRIVELVINRLEQRIEKEGKITTDKPFLDLVGVYHTFMRSYMDHAETFGCILSSFKVLVTGLTHSRDSYQLFMFLHSTLRPLVEFFFTKLSPERRRALGVSEFYCKNFLSFYDNARDFGEAFVERSERRHLACVDFFVNFIECYPKQDTLRLMEDFHTVHKIEQCLSFSLYSVRIAALQLTSAILSLPFVGPSFFDSYPYFVLPGILESDEACYEEKCVCFSVIEKFLFSGELQKVHGVLCTGILDSILFCCEPRMDKLGYPVWGQHLKQPIWDVALALLKKMAYSGIPTVVSVLLESRDVLESLYNKGISVPPCDFGKMMLQMKTEGIISQSLVSTLTFLEKSSLGNIATITGLDKPSFEQAMIDLGDAVLEMGIIDCFELFATVIRIQAVHKLTPNKRLLDAILSDFMSNRPGIIDSLVLILNTFETLPESYVQIPQIWIPMLRAQFEIIRSACRKEIRNFELTYLRERPQRLKLFRAIIRQQYPPFKEFFETKCDYVDLIFTEMLLDPNKFEVNLNVVPPHFADYNRTFLIRNEGINFIAEIIKNRERCPQTFYHFSALVKKSGILASEGDMLMRVNDPDYRKGSIRFMELLESAGSVFKISTMIRRSELLMALKDEGVRDWDNFQLMRNAWNSTRAPRPKRERPLFNAV